MTGVANDNMASSTLSFYYQLAFFTPGIRPLSAKLPSYGNKYDRCQTCGTRREVCRKFGSATLAATSILASWVPWQFLICSPRRFLSFLVL